MDFSDSVVACDITVDFCKQLHELLKRSRSFTDLYPGCLSIFNFFQMTHPLKLLGLLKPSYMWSLHWVGKQKSARKDQGKGPAWLPHPYMVKIFENLLRN